MADGSPLHKHDGSFARKMMAGILVCFILLQAKGLYDVSNHPWFLDSSIPLDGADYATPIDLVPPRRDAHTDGWNDMATTASTESLVQSLTQVPTATPANTRLRVDGTLQSPHAHRIQQKMPQLVLHVGPSKTATSTMQANMQELKQKGVFEQDNYVYWGRESFDGRYGGIELNSIGELWNVTCMHKEYADYLQRKRHSAEARNANNLTISSTEFDSAASLPTHAVPACIRNVKNLLDSLRQDGMSLIVSDELYSWRTRFRNRGIYHKPMFFDHLQDLLQGWNVTVVVTYRRVFDWMLSSIKQDHSRKIDKAFAISQWSADGGKPQERTWPIICGWVRQSLPLARDPNRRKTATGTYVFMDGSIHVWNSGGFATHILNMHSQRHITQQLICDFIHDAPYSCRYLEEKKDNPPRNVRNMLWYKHNDIVFSAAERGVIPKNKQARRSRISFANLLALYHGHTCNKTMADLPLVCPSDDQLEHFLNMSLSIERQLMPDWYASPEGESLHRSAFQHTAYRKREFCEVDLDRLFENVTSWNGLLRNLNRTWD